MADFYVDFSASNDGDGSTHSQAGAPAGAGAYNTLDSKTFTTGDKVWIRRVTRSSDYSADITFGVAGVLYIGWPVSGDEHYAARPAGAQASWDGDGGTYAEFSFNSASFELNVTANNMQTHRLKVNQKATNADPIVLGASVTGFKAYNCHIGNSNASGSAATTLFQMASGNTDCIFQGCTFYTTAFAPQGSTGFISLAGARNTILDCIVSITTCTPASSTFNSIFQITAADNYISGNAITIGTLAGSIGLIALYFSSSCTGSIATNNVFTATAHTATSSEYAVLMSGIGGIVRGLQCNFGKGISITTSGNYVEAISLTQRHAITTGSILISSSCHGNEIHVSNMTFISGNTNGDVILNGENNVVYLRNCAFSASTPIAIASGSTNRWYSFDHDQVVGNFEHGAKGGTIISSNTARTGGETFSLKYEMSGVVAISKGELCISRKGAETIWLALSSGSNTITIYGAYKNYTTLLAHDIWAELEYSNASDIPTVLSTFAINDALASDASTWTGDTGLTKFKLEIAFSIPSDQVVPIRLFGCKYESGAYLYIDPKPVIT